MKVSPFQMKIVQVHDEVSPIQNTVEMASAVDGSNISPPHFKVVARWKEMASHKCTLVTIYIAF